MLFEIKPREPRMQFICDLKPPTMLDHIKSIIKYFKTDRNNKYPGRWVNDWYMIICFLLHLILPLIHFLLLPITILLYPWIHKKKNIITCVWIVKTRFMVKMGYIHYPDEVKEAIFSRDLFKKK